MSHVTVFTGGRGGSTILQALVGAGHKVSVIINGFDDGFSTGLMRRTFPRMLGPSDFRKVAGSLVAPAMNVVMERRVTLAWTPPSVVLGGPMDLSGAWDAIKVQSRLEGYRGDIAVGNIVFAALFLKYGNSQKAIQEYQTLLCVPDTVDLLAASEEPTALSALTADGGVLTSEDAICASRFPIRDIMWTPGVLPAILAFDAVVQADTVILAPGTFHSSLLPSVYLLKDALSRHGKVAWVVNYLSEAGTQGLTWEDLWLKLRGLPQVVLLDRQSELVGEAKEQRVAEPMLGSYTRNDGKHDGEQVLSTLRLLGYLS